MRSTATTAGRLPAYASLAAAALLAALVSSCLERTDGALPVARGVNTTAASWELADTFGGDAQRAVDSADPWEVRFKPGGFKEIAGLCVHEDELWVCDLGISRIQVFDFNGKFLRQYGAGVPIAGTLATNKELYLEQKGYDYNAEVKPARWEQGPGVPWTLDFVNLFKAADVVVAEDGFIIADQARTGAQRQPRRRDVVALIRWDGTRQVFDSEVVWPTYLALDGSALAIAECPGNTLMMAEVASERWPSQRISEATNFDRIMEINVELTDMSQYYVGMALASNAGTGPKNFNGLGGVAAAFDKVIACDTGNQKLKVYDSRRSDPIKWCSLIRAVTARKRDGSVRFVAPRNVAVDHQGNIYVLDLNPQRIEIAVLNPTFERSGGFGRDELISPVDIGISADSRHFFVTDLSDNRVLHYVRAD